MVLGYNQKEIILYQEGKSFDENARSYNQFRYRNVFGVSGFIMFGSGTNIWSQYNSEPFDSIFCGCYCFVYGIEILAITSCKVVFLIHPIHTTFQLVIIKKWLNSNLTCGINI
jgi:hypothetical protein